MRNTFNRRRGNYRSERESNNPNRRRNQHRSDHDDQFNRDRAHSYGSMFETEDFDDVERFYDDGESEHFFNDDRNREGYANDNPNVNPGYKRRRNNQPNPYYTDKYTYRTSDWDKDGYRLNDEADNYNQYNEGYEQNEDYDYDYFQSYPHYGKNNLQEDMARNNEDFHLKRNWRRRRPNTRDQYW